MFFVFETAMSSSPEQMQPEIKAVLAPDKNTHDRIGLVIS